MALSFTLMEANTKEIGRSIKWKAVGVSTISLGNWLTMESGSTINFQEEECYTMSLLRLWRNRMLFRA